MKSGDAMKAAHAAAGERKQRKASNALIQAKARQAMSECQLSTGLTELQIIEWHRQERELVLARVRRAA